MRVTAEGNEGCLFVNGEFVSCFDISGYPVTDEIRVASALSDVRYRGVVVRPILPAGVPTPTPTPIPTPTPNPKPIPTATTPPPEWIFTPDVSEADRQRLQQEMEKVRAFFYGKYDVEASNFVVVAGDDEGIDAQSQRLTGRPAPKGFGGWVSKTLDGRPFMGVFHKRYSTGSYTHGWWVIAHEYFHILQGMLIGGSGYTSPSQSLPQWLVEGHAVYADYLYSHDETLVRNRSHDLFRFSLEKPGVALGDLREVDSFWDDRASGGDRFYVYSVGFAAAQYLGDPAYIEFWKVLGQGIEWKEALRKVSGVGFDDFDLAFREWLPTYIAQLMYVSVDVRWPGMGSPALQRAENLSFGIEWVPSYPFPSSTSNGDGQTKLTKAYDGGTTGKGYVCLKWRGLGVGHTHTNVIGWYSDGSLVSRDDAELIKFTGESITLKDWNLTGHPNTLPPRTGEGTTCN